MPGLRGAGFFSERPRELKTKTLLVLAAIVLIPLVLLGWLGLRVILDEQELRDHQIRALIQSRLKGFEDTVLDHFENLAAQFTDASGNLSYTTNGLRQFVRETPTIRQVFWFDAKDKRRFPPGDSPLTRKESQFLERTKSILGSLGEESVQANQLPDEESALPGGGLLDPSQRILEKVKKGKGGANKNVSITGPVSQGWYVWFSGAEQNHIFWVRDRAGRLIGFELEPMRLISDIIGELPESGPENDSTDNSQIRLIDSKGSPVYQWGSYLPQSNEPNLGMLPLGPPLNSWKLEYFGAGLSGGLDLNWFNWVAGLAVVGAALLGLAIFLYREHTREVNLAQQRVNFVNQVSHELKTPLTNIRLYAEMLEDRILDQEEAEEPSKTRHYLRVITSESQRLSRLIGNVLTFSRGNKDRLVLRPQPGCVDRIIENTLSAFKPSLDSNKVEIHFNGNAGNRVMVDVDAVEQILNNLFSNVEKYGASGGRLEVESGRAGDQTIIRVRDYGPGISARESKRIFNPFYRISSRLTDGVTGTGIGLSIARQLAQMHGGTLTLMPVEKGALFQVKIRTPGVANSI